MHYQFVISKKTTELQYFNQRTRWSEKGCLEWTKSKNRLGYGVFSLHKRRTGAHRFSYQFFVGDIPRGLSVLHNCHNRACVNPAHLRIGTHLDNMGDRKKIGNYDVGPNRTISDEMILEIYNSKGSEHEIARKIGVPRSIVHNVRSGRFYHNVTGGKPSPFHRRVNDPNPAAAKSFRVTSPSGESEIIMNLSPWCRENQSKFPAKETKTPLWEKIRSGIIAPCGYKGWHATALDI